MTNAFKGERKLNQLTAEHLRLSKWKIKTEVGLNVGHTDVNNHLIIILWGGSENDHTYSFATVRDCGTRENES